MDASDFVGNFQLAQKLHLETLSQMRALEVSKIQVSYFGFNGDTEFDPVEMYDRDKNLGYVQTKVGILRLRQT